MRLKRLQLDTKISVQATKPGLKHDSERPGGILKGEQDTRHAGAGMPQQFSHWGVRFKDPLPKLAEDGEFPAWYGIPLPL
jgi:hypothetical protein